MENYRESKEIIGTADVFQPLRSRDRRGGWSLRRHAGVVERPVGEGSPQVGLAQVAPAGDGKKFLNTGNLQRARRCTPICSTQ